jgi:hypothetical protein
VAVRFIGFTRISGENHIIIMLFQANSDKTYRYGFKRSSRGEVMISFEKNKILGVEPNRVLNILEGI